MENVIPYFANLLNDDGFFRFQNEVAQAMYGALGQGFANNDNEVALVTRLVEAVDGLSYRGITLHSRKIHGSRSFVEFNHQDRPITKELADSVFITVVTRKRERLLQRVCFVQNKVAKHGGWQLDQGQLCLLKNFPLFSGRRGLFKGSSDVTFKNLGKTLGAFGLFHEPSEMMLITAPLVADLARGGGTLKAEAVSVPELASAVTAGSAPGGMPWFPSHPGLFPPDAFEIFFHEMHRLFRHFGSMPFWPWAGGSTPFLARATFMRDLHDLARNWLFANVGEYSYAFDHTPDPALDRFAGSLLSAAGAKHFFDIGGDNAELESNLAVFIAHIEIGEG